MASALPLEAEKHYVAGSVPQTIKNLTAAAERGEFGYGVIAAFIRTVERGLDPRFMKTRPVPLAIREAIEASPEIEPRKIVYRGLEQGRWEWADVEAFEENAAALSQSRKPEARRGTYLTRGRRSVRKRPRTEGAFVPKMPLDAVCDQTICDGAKACLALIMARAGKSSVLVTYTSSLADQLGRTPRTVRNYLMQLEAAELIRRSPGRHANTVKIDILETCRPEPYREPADIAAYRVARRSSDPAVRQLAETVAAVAAEVHPDLLRPEERRKGISAFNLDSRVLVPVAPGWPPESQPWTGMSPPTTHSRMLERPPRHDWVQARPPKWSSGQHRAIPG